MVFDIIRFIVNIKKFTGTKYLQIMAVISQIYIDPATGVVTVV